MVPNHSHVPRDLFNTGLFDLRTHAGQGAFVDAVVSVLHTLDPRWGHLKKKPGQTAIHGHGEDAALYLADTPGQSQAVDFVGGAGGPDPRPTWQVDAPRYSESDWWDPTEHASDAVIQPPSYPPYPYPEDPVDAAGAALFADFGEAGQAPNPQMFRFAFRVAYSWLTKEVPDLAASVMKHRPVWRRLLGL